MKRKGYIYVSVEEDVRVETCDIIGDITDEELLDELKDRKLLTEDQIEVPVPTEGIKLKEYLCDIFLLSHHTTNEQLLSELKLRL